VGTRYPQSDSADDSAISFVTDRFEPSQSMIVLVDRQYQCFVVNANRHSADNQGRGRPTAENLGAELVSAAKPQLEECFAGRVVNFRMLCIYPRLGAREISVLLFPLEGQNGVDRAGCILSDITEQKRADTALRESEDRFQKLFRCSPMVMMLLRVEDDRFLEVSETFERLLGLSRKNVIGSTSGELAIWEDFGGLEKLKTELLTAAGTVRDIECKLRTMDGRSIVALLSADLIQVRGELCAIIAMADITKLKRVEQSLRESEEKFAKAFHESPMSLTLVRIKDNCYLEVNESFERLCGFKRDEVVGRSALDLGIWQPVDRVDPVKRLLAQGRLRDQEFLLHTKDGKTRVGLVSADAIEIQNELCSLVATADITALKQTQEALVREKSLTDALFSAMPGMLFLFDESGRPIRWNKQAEAITHYSAGEISQMHLLDFHPVKSKDGLADIMAGVFEKGHVEEEATLLTKSGRQIPFYFASASLTIDGKRHFVMVGIDIGERKRIEKERQDLSARLISAHDEERSRIARELHDDVSQKLALLSVEIDQLTQRRTHLKEQIRTRLQEVKDGTIELANTIHNLSRQLHPSVLTRVGFRASLEGLVREMRERGLDVQMSYRNMPTTISQEISLCLFRVAQEALNNVVKHSGAKKARVEIEGDSVGVRMRIIDAGHGFDPRSKAFRAGLGLLSMKERVVLVGGRFWVRHLRTGGTEVEAFVPLTAERKALSA
jgi:PAS domain S-box-containing protein